MRFFYRLGLLLAILLLALRGYSQQAIPLISGQFTHLSFEQFVHQLEGRTPYHFYFDPAAVDSIQVEVRVEAQSLSSVLTLVFQHTDLHFAIDPTNRVFITKGIALETTLPTDFFQPHTTSRPTANQRPRPSREGLASEPAPNTLAALEMKVVEIGANQPLARGQATLAGHVRDFKTGEPVVGAAVYVDVPTIGVTTDQFGSYAITLPVGPHLLRVRGLGIRATKRPIVLHSDGTLEIEAVEEVTPLKEVVIEAEKDKNVTSTQMGVAKLDIKAIKQVPTVFGEADVLRVVMTLPGVKTIGEGNTGLSVRGGFTDQNLILFNDATVFNPSHLFGFFSAFNPDIIKSVELYKSLVPAQYGGRLSSVLDINTRDGNRKQLAGSGGIGLLTSRLALEGPLAKGKGSFLIGGRTSYSDWLLHRLPDASLRNSAASFYDLTAHLTYDLNDHNSLYATGYFSHDQFKLGNDTLYAYHNLAASLKWKHVVNNKLYTVFTGTFSQYQYEATSQRNPVTSSRLAYALNQGGLRADASYFHSARHTFDGGISTLLYYITPGSLTPNGGASLVKPNVLDSEQALESAVYAADHITISPRLSLDLGLRYSLYNALGPRSVYQYQADVPLSESTITGTATYGASQVLATYHGPEYRIGTRLALTPNSSLKLSYNRMRQYINQLTNTATASPTDTWKLSDNYLQPQVSDQVGLGYYHNFKNNTIEASVETYYKKLHNVLDYRSGAQLLLNHHLETDVVSAEGKAYGVEVLVRKSSGKLNGWLSYTYSRSLLRVNTGPELINGGNYYPSNFDKPHDATLVGNYRVTQRLSFSLNVNYSTGRPITLPLAVYYIDNSPRLYYSERNAYRVPDYFRLDIGVNLEGNHRVKKLAHSSWTVGVYNLTGRKNPYSVYYESQNGKITGYQLSIFGQPIPTITYNFRF